MNWKRASAILSLTLLCISVLCAGQKAPERPKAVRPSNNALAARGFDELYNADYGPAIRDFTELRNQFPNDPFPKLYLIAAELFQELERIGALNTESYSAEGFLKEKPRRPLDPEVRKEIFDLISQVEAECNARLEKDPDDVDALYARGVARGFASTYKGMAEKAWLSAIRSALAARRDHERVLELDPSYVDAKTTVGIHNYIMGSLNWPTRMLVKLVGVSGDRKKGLRYLREVSQANVTSSNDAALALSLFLRREQRYEEALKLVKGLSERYPRNFLIAVEYANLLNAAGHGLEAIAQYRLVLANGREGKYSHFYPEMAAWGLGISLRGQRLFLHAAEAFDMVAAVPDADPVLVVRATLAAGEMYDTLGQREKAIERYRRVIRDAADDERAKRAHEYLQHPYHYDKK
jgi:tetratricopeptide (TPR) repeat protein